MASDRGQTQDDRDLALCVAIALAAVALPWLANDYIVGVGTGLLMWIALTQSWALLASLSGYVSLGHVLFFGLGAYVVVVSWEVLPLAVSLPLAALAAALLALLAGYPVLRVRGPYFVILTFGIAELAKYIVLAIDAELGHASRFILGAPGLEVIYWMLLALALAACVLGWAVRRSRLGTGLRAVRENEEAAETLGVPVARYKLVAFVLSALIPGAVGGVMALRTTYFEAVQAFDPMVSFNMIAMAIIGGGDRLRGPLLGALLLFVLSELLWANAPQLYMIILGLLLVTFVLFLPAGLAGGLRRQAR